ncbi:universal stress protein [Streptomyces sp. NPDC020379]|uniref:universal stress protein n=1 Tax=Streptomyces sp. NPDC020379 TaxID=3365071 RepID=UPI00378FE9F6
MANPTGRVIVGVKGAPGSLPVLRRALEEARRYGAELHAVIACPVPESTVAGPCWMGGPGARDEERKTAARTLYRACVTALGDSFGGVDFTAFVALGRPGTVLVDYAGRQDDILVIGTGTAGRPRLFGGSVTRDCVRHARCPVLLVPPSELAREYRKGLRRWNGWVRKQADEIARAAVRQDISRL